jgi:hypothetical protein
LFFEAGLYNRTILLLVLLVLLLVVVLLVLLLVVVVLLLLMSVLLLGVLMRRPVDESNWLLAVVLWLPLRGVQGVTARMNGTLAVLGLLRSLALACSSCCCQARKPFRPYSSEL